MEKLDEGEQLNNIFKVGKFVKRMDSSGQRGTFLLLF